MLETDRDYATQHQLCSEETRDRILENVFRCINNAFIDRLEISFHRRALPLPYYVRANAEHLQCKILTLCVSGLPARIDYALFDFLAVHLNPQVYEMSLRTWIWSADYAMYFAHDAFHGNVRHVVCEVSNLHQSQWSARKKTTYILLFLTDLNTLSSTILLYRTASYRHCSARTS